MEDKKFYDRKDKFREKRKPYKQRGEFKQETKEMVDEAEQAKDQQQSVVAASTFPSLTLVNSMLVNVGTGSDKAIMFSVIDATAPVFGGSSTAFDLVIPLWDEYIRSYSTARGYTSTSTGTDIRNVLRRSFEAYGYLLALLRAQNAKNIRTQSGVNVGRAITDGFTNPSTPIQNVLRGNTPTIATVNGNSITNVVWSNDYVGKLNNILLSEPLVRLCNQLYLVGYSLQDISQLGNSSVIQLFPDGSRDCAAEFTSEVATIAALFASKPDLKIIMESLGFNSDLVQSGNYSRDLNGETYTLVHDPLFTKSLVNGQTFNTYAAVIDDDIRNLWIEPTSNSSVFSFTESGATSEADLLSLILRDGVSLDTHAKIYNTDGTYRPTSTPVTCAIMSPGRFTVTGATILADTVSNFQPIMQRILDANHLHALLFGDSVPFVWEGNIAGTSALPDFLAVTNESVVTTGIPEGASAYVFNRDEFTVVVRVIGGIMAHGANWRADLALKTRALAKQASNINY